MVRVTVQVRVRATFTVSARLRVRVIVTVRVTVTVIVGIMDTVLGLGSGVEFKSCHLKRVESGVHVVLIILCYICPSCLIGFLRADSAPLRPQCGTVCSL